VLESAYAIKTGTLLSLAEQELVDCMMVNKTTGIGEGCAGGWPYDAMKFAETYDFCTEETYPYTATDGRCALSTGKGCSVGLKAGTVKGYVSVPTNETGFLAAVNETVNETGCERDRLPRQHCDHAPLDHGQGGGEHAAL